MIYFHLSDSWEAKSQLQWVTWLHEVEQFDLSCGIVWVHSKCVCIVHGLFHIKIKVTAKKKKKRKSKPGCQYIHIVEIYSQYK